MPWTLEEGIVECWGWNQEPHHALHVLSSLSSLWFTYLSFQSDISSVSRLPTHGLLKWLLFTAATPVHQTHSLARDSRVPMKLQKVLHCLLGIPLRPSEGTAVLVVGLEVA